MKNRLWRFFTLSIGPANWKRTSKKKERDKLKRTKLRRKREKTMKTYEKRGNRGQEILCGLLGPEEGAGGRKK